MRNKLFIIPILTLLLLANACKDTEDIIPTYRFSTQITDIGTHPDFTQSNTFIVKYDSYGNLIGNTGVVVYRQSADVYYVFDLMCPYEKKLSSLIKIEGDIFCVCPTCKSKFLVASEYGDVLEGPSKWPLYKYNTKEENGTLHIWN